MLLFINIKDASAKMVFIIFLILPLAIASNVSLNAKHAIIIDVFPVMIKMQTLLNQF
jgi:hypothetical protein